MANVTAKKGLQRELRQLLPAQLPEFLKRQRWFGGKARQILSAEIVDTVPLRLDEFEALLLIAKVHYVDMGSEVYALPVAFAEPNAANLANDSVAIRVCEDETGRSRTIVDALQCDEFLQILLTTVRDESIWAGGRGNVGGFRSSEFSRISSGLGEPVRPKRLQGEQSNSSAIYGGRLILKLFRRLEPGVNPDLEIARFLTEKARFAHVPALAGHLEYRTESECMTLGILQEFVANEGDAWRYMQKSLTRFYADVRAHARELPEDRQVHGHTGRHVPEFLRGNAEQDLAWAKLLGKRTAELHLALSSDTTDADFAPEPFTTDFQQTLLQSSLELTRSTLRLLRKKLPELTSNVREAAERVARAEEQIQARMRATLSTTLHATRTRIHGDYHLGQVLYTGSDFVIIDFEGEPARPLAERRAKRSPLQDVAGMLRSFHYAAFAPVVGSFDENSVSRDEITRLAPWANAWTAWMSEAFLSSYLRTSGAASYLPSNPSEREKLLEFHVLGKAVYELRYELNNRPRWVGIPVEGIETLLSP